MSTPGVVGVLRDAARGLVESLGAGGCVVSRVIGDVLINVAEHVPSGGTLRLGTAYLVPEYPETRAVLELRRACALSLTDDDVDLGEAAILEELGFDALLMLPLVAGGEVWGLVEVYRGTGAVFSPAEARRAGAAVEELGRTLDGVLQASAV